MNGNLKKGGVKRKIGTRVLFFDDEAQAQRAQDSFDQTMNMKKAGLKTDGVLHTPQKDPTANRVLEWLEG